LSSIHAESAVKGETPKRGEFKVFRGGQSNKGGVGGIGKKKD